MKKLKSLSLGGLILICLLFVFAVAAIAVVKPEVLLSLGALLIFGG